MFPTFISILDIQSWWEVPSIAYFCSLFRTSFNLLDFDIEDLEEALLTDGTEDPSWLQELIVRLLTGCLNNNNEISTFNYQMYLRRLFRQKCQETGERNPFNSDIDFQFLPLRTKVQILHTLCDYRLDAEDVLERLKNLEADSLRVEPLGHDENDSQYWYFYGTRLYREDHPIGSLNSSGKKSKTVWQVICFTEDDWHNLSKKFKNSTAKSERRLYKVLKENFLPDLPRLFHEKEVLHRKRLLEWLPMRRGASLRRAAAGPPPQAPQTPKKPTRKHKSDDDDSENDDTSNDTKDTSEKKKQNSPAPKKRKSRELRALTDGRDQSNEPPKPISCGRQTNNSLASATGDRILIKQATPPPATPKKVTTTKKAEKDTKEEPAKRGRKKKDTTAPPAKKPPPEPIITEVNVNTDLDDMRIGMYKILEAVKAHEDAWPFIEPVEEEYAPNYYTVVRRPMDLQTMEDRLDAGAYTTLERFKHDFKLIVENCRLYNGAENEYTEMVDNISNAFNVALKKYLDQPTQSSSEDDEEDIIKNGQKRSTSPISKVKPIKKITQSKKKTTPVRKRTPTPPPRSPTPPKVVPEKRGRGRPKNKIEKKPKSRTPSPEIKKEEERRKGKGEGNGEKEKSNKRKSDAEGEEKVSKKVKQEETPKDKNLKLKETIEKLKEMNNLSDEPLKKKVAPKKEVPPKKEAANKLKPLIKTTAKKCEFDFDSDSDKESKKKPLPIKKPQKSVADIDALEAATEQTLKDINKWLDDTPKFSEFSSASNSPLHLPEDPEIHSIGAVSKIKPHKEFRMRGGKRKTLTKEGSGTPPGLKRTSTQRTIDRLQPGKSKGNLITKEQTGIPEDEPLYPLGRIREAKGIAIKTPDETGPKLSLGTVLDSFGQHQFETDEDKTSPPKTTSPVLESASEEVKTESVVEEKEKEVEKEEKVEEEVKKEEKVEKEEVKDVKKSATPNLSAWFKAFGAPKVTAQPKKKVEPEEEKVEEKEIKASPRRAGSLEPESPFGGPVRQRRGSTGSSVSERSSFSQDLDMSPRDERTGAGSYPAPYPSPLHRSPAASASPSPRHDPHQYPAALNGTIRVGFYQDVSKGSPSPIQASPARVSPAREDFQVPSYYQSKLSTIAPNSPPPPTPQIRPPTPDDPVPFPVKKRVYQDDNTFNSPRSDDDERHDFSITKDVRIPSLPRRYDDSPPPPTPNPQIEREPKVVEEEKPIDYGVKTYTEPKIPIANVGYQYDDLRKDLRKDEINMGYVEVPSDALRLRAQHETFEPSKIYQKVDDKVGYEPLRIPSDPKLNMGYEKKDELKNPYESLRIPDKLTMAPEALRIPTEPKMNIYDPKLQKEDNPYEALRKDSNNPYEALRKDDKNPYEALRIPQDKLVYEKAQKIEGNPYEALRIPQEKLNVGYDKIQKVPEKINPYESLRIPTDPTKLTMGYDSRTEQRVDPLRNETLRNEALRNETLRNEALRNDPLHNEKLNMGYMSGVTSIDLTGPSYSSTSSEKPQPQMRNPPQYHQYADARLNHPVASYLAAMQPGNFTKQPSASNFKPATTEASQFKQAAYQSNTSPLPHNFDRFSAELHSMAYYADKNMFNKMHMYSQQMAAYRTQQQLIQPDLQYHQQQQSQQMNQVRGSQAQVVTTTEQKREKKKRSVNVAQQQQPVQGFQSYAELKASGGSEMAPQTIPTSTPQLKGSAFNLPWSEQAGPLLDAAVVAASWAQRGGTGPAPGTTSSAYTSLTAPPPPYLTQPTAAPSIDQPLYQQYLQTVGMLTGGHLSTGGTPPQPPAPYPHPHHPHHPQYHPTLAPQLGRQQPFHNMNRPWM